MDWLIGFILLVIKLGLVLIGLLLVAAYLVLAERKFLARLQIRYGPNRAGKFGLLQPIADTVKMGGADGTLAGTVDRSRLWAAQTPQIFRYDILLRAHREVTADVTDDASMLEALGLPVKLYPGSPLNIKVTTPEDLNIAEALLRQAARPGAHRL